MKIFTTAFILLCVFATTQLKSQTTIAFTYDAAGNMIQRQVQVLPPLPPISSARTGSNTQTKHDSTEVLPPLGFKVYPNPASTKVTIEGKLPQDAANAKWQLTNDLGQVLDSGNYNGDAQSINVADLKSGCYFLQVIYAQNKKSTYKIIVSN